VLAAGAVALLGRRRSRRGLGVVRGDRFA